MKIDTIPLEGVASQDCGSMSRAEREHRLWLRTGFLPRPYYRIWTRSEAIQLLNEFNELTILGGREKAQRLSLGVIEDQMRAHDYRHFRIIEDPEPGDFL